MKRVRVFTSSRWIYPLRRTSTLGIVLSHSTFWQRWRNTERTCYKLYRKRIYRQSLNVQFATTVKPNKYPSFPVTIISTRRAFWNGLYQTPSTRVRYVGAARSLPIIFSSSPCSLASVLDQSEHHSYEINGRLKQNDGTKKMWYGNGCFLRKKGHLLLCIEAAIYNIISVLLTRRYMFNVPRIPGWNAGSAKRNLYITRTKWGSIMVLKTEQRSSEKVREDQIV